MPNYDKYPCGQDVQNILINTGITLTTGLDYDEAAKAAIAEFENRTGWYPFLAGPPSTRFFDPPRMGPSAGRTEADRGGKELILGVGLLDLPDDGVRIGVVPNTAEEIGIAEGITSTLGSAGTVLTRDIQYYLLPHNADQMGLPWTKIYFMTPVRGVRKSIQITNGVWGYTRKLPANVWRAIAQKGAAILAPEISLSISQGLASIKTESFGVQFSGGAQAQPLLAQAKAWNVAFNAQIRQYMRVTA